MTTSKITGKDLLELGYPEGKVIGMALDLVESNYKGKSKQQKLEILERVIENPAFYVKHKALAPIAQSLINQPQSKSVNDLFELHELPLSYKVYGGDNIEEGAAEQMRTAMRLPIAKAGALMPDAHLGYGLPIGGVLATENTVIPYAVGVDIGCRMCMTVYDMDPGYVVQHSEDLKKILVDNTRFGHQAFKDPDDDPVLERNIFNEINILKSLKDRAAAQIGSSGGGNHFVEFGITEIVDENNEWSLTPGKYLALLSHSGSRGLGANIARHYTQLAMNKCKLPKEARHLAWLNLDSEEGQEYWQAMTLAGDYASACHHHIHRRVSKALGNEPLTLIENHHNFAWKERDTNGNEVIVHRKGATPAGKDALGIIPGSMTSPGFIVRGKGNEMSLNSAAHGAGRVMSRRQAKKTLSKKEVSKIVKKYGVTLIGSGLDEAPMVYKDIYQVMDYQKDLVDVLGKFTPKVVRMCGDPMFIEVD